MTDRQVTGYQHPVGRRPPLAFGGHDWLAIGDPLSAPLDGIPSRLLVWQCRCGATVPHWAIAEGFWPVLAGRYCFLAMRAIGTGR